MAAHQIGRAMGFHLGDILRVDKHDFSIDTGSWIGILVRTGDGRGTSHCFKGCKFQGRIARIRLVPKRSLIGSTRSSSDNCLKLRRQAFNTPFHLIIRTSRKHT